ncbi:uncharacterized protein LOC125680776 [Ostrea edulis]|uniref:uncharacterized protein LOC125680776 n=1 Tax=Ostrea edulis TaxID=37623 RepID=UPI0024AF6929|nr:uncharacterized protein LOC125680776 [Ostrea edulis]
MEFLKVLVVLVVAVHGSLSKPISSEDELRVIVGQLERQVASLRQYVVDKNMPEYSLSGAGPLLESTPEFPFSGTEMFGKLLRPYFSSFPDGPYTSEVSLTPDDIMTMLKSWYSVDQTFKERTFFNVAREILNAHFQCATTKINQMVYYVLKEQARAMTEDDQNMNTRARKILENWITDTATVDKVTQKIVMSAHRHTYGEIMDNIRYFQFKDIVQFLGKIKLFLWKARQNNWTPLTDEKLNQLLTDHDFVFKCPSVNDLWEFHQEIASTFQERFSVAKPFHEAETWLNKVLPTYMSTEATHAVTAILQVYKDYIKSAMQHFQEVEDHMTTRNTADIMDFMSKFLSPHQLQYLQSTFEFLNVDTSNVMEANESRESNRRSERRCTDFDRCA